MLSANINISILFVGKFWMDNIYCTGEELSLDKCRFDGWGSSDCAESEAAGVICYNEESLETTVPPLKIKPRKLKKIGVLTKILSVWVKKSKILTLPQSSGSQTVHHGTQGHWKN